MVDAKDEQIKGKSRANKRREEIGEVIPDQ